MQSVFAESYDATRIAESLRDEDLKREISPLRDASHHSGRNDKRWGNKVGTPVEMTLLR